LQYYAGIGSRQTPSNILGKMRKIAKDLCCYKDLILRTRAAHTEQTPRLKRVVWTVEEQRTCFYLGVRTTIGLQT